MSRTATSFTTEATEDTETGGEALLKKKGSAPPFSVPSVPSVVIRCPYFNPARISGTFAGVTFST